jgi:hypothetical protein
VLDVTCSPTFIAWPALLLRSNVAADAHAERGSKARPSR